MRRIPLGVPCKAASVVLALGLTLAARGDEAMRQRVLALGRITGDDPLNGELQTLVAKPKLTKQLLAEGLTMLKDKEQPLRYNAAFVLAQAASELKDIKSSEAFYRGCMDQAAKLQSTRK